MQPLTGYPSIDKPWLKYYSEEAISASLPEGSLFDYMLSCNEKHMNHVALNYFGKRITYQQFVYQIERCAKALVAHGICKGDTVSVCMLTMPETLVLLYAINRIGGVCNFLILNATEQEMHRQIMQTNSKLVFSVNLVAEKVEKAAKDTMVQKIINIPLYESMPIFKALMYNLKSKEQYTKNKIMSWKEFLLKGKGVDIDFSSVRSEDVALLEYTSGTTGESKGVILTNQAINAVAFQYGCSNNLFEFRSKEKFLCMIPPFLSVGLVTTLIMPLCMGFELILSPSPNPSETAKNIVKYKPNHFCGGPPYIENIVSNPKIKKLNLSFLKTVAYGGDKKDINWEQQVSAFLAFHRSQCKLVNGYGLTETASTFCKSTHKTNFLIPFVKNNVMICDIESQKELVYGYEGEIFVSGPSVMGGYYKNKVATDEVIIEKDGVRWLRTGDLGMVTEDGALYVTGRLKRIFWRVGDGNIIYRIYPMKIEEVICKSASVQECGVVGAYDDEKGYLPIAFVVMKNKEACQSIVEKNILDMCKKELNMVSQPYAVCFIDRLPSTKAGKVDFQQLERMANSYLARV